MLLANVNVVNLYGLQQEVFECVHFFGSNLGF